MTTSREQRLRERTYAKEQRSQKVQDDVAIQAEVDSRYAAIHGLPEPVKNCLRGLVSCKDSLAREVLHLREARVKDEATLKESEDELEEVKHTLQCQTTATEDCFQAFKDMEKEKDKLQEGNATLRNVIQNMTLDNQKLEDASSEMEKRDDEVVQQNNLLSKSFEDILNEQKKLLKAVDTAGSLLANASMAQSIVMMQIS